MTESWRDILVDNEFFNLNEPCYQVAYWINNFYMKLPDLVKPSYLHGEPGVLSGFQRRIALEVGLMDFVHSEKADPKNHSFLWLGQTERQFFGTIDEVIREIGAEKDIKNAQIATIEADFLLKKGLETEPQRVELLDNVEIGERLAAYPVFCRLLDMGYSEYDLSI